jgi:hypothetical protein
MRSNPQPDEGYPYFLQEWSRHSQRKARRFSILGLGVRYRSAITRRRDYQDATGCSAMIIKILILNFGRFPGEKRYRSRCASATTAPEAWRQSASAQTPGHRFPKGNA